MSINKKINKEKYKAYLLENNGFILNIKHRGEYAEFEDKTCIGSFEIAGGFENMPKYYTNLHIELKDKYAIVSNADRIRITKRIEKEYKHPRDVFEFPQVRNNKLINIFKSWFRLNFR